MTNKIITFCTIGLLLALISGTTMAVSVNTNLSTGTSWHPNASTNSSWGIGFRNWYRSWFHSSNSVNWNSTNNRTIGFFGRMGLDWMRFRADVSSRWHI